MKHVLFFKILMIVFVFGCGLNACSNQYEGKPAMALINLFIHIATAILLGIGICLLP